MPFNLMTSTYSTVASSNVKNNMFLVGYTVFWYQHFGRDAPVFSGHLLPEKDQNITVKTAAGFLSTFRLVPESCVSYLLQPAEKPPLHAMRMSLSCSTTSILVWRCACSVTSSATRRRSWCAVVAVLPITHSAWIPLGSTRPQTTGGAPSASRKSTTDHQKCTALSRQRRSTL